MVLIKNSNTKIVAIVGPKGGVGKTTISANLAIALSKLGKKVIAVDLDLGASNLHTLFGIRETKASLDDFVLNKITHLPDVVMNTDVNNLSIICGGNIPGIANLHYNKKLKLIRNLSQLKADFVLLDLGAGASSNVVDFLIIAQDGVLVTTPEVPSLQ
jgi:flagellar biosynthesis protein FlhG